MAKADQREHDQVPKQPEVDPSLLADMEEPATAKVRALLQQGVANAGMFAKIVHENPQAKGEIVALLNRKLGNGFTTKVVEISEVEDSPRQGKPPVMSQAARDELNDGAYSSDGTTARKPKDAAIGKPPSKADQDAATDVVRHEDDGEKKTPKPPSKEAIAEATDVVRHEDDSEKKTPKPPSKEAIAETTDVVRHEDDGEKRKHHAAVGTNTTIAGSQEVSSASIDKKDDLLDHSDNGDAAPGSATASLGPVKVTASALRVRTSPDTKSPKNVIGQLQHGATVNVVAHAGEWLEIDYKGQRAFIHGSYVKSLSSDAAPQTAKKPDAATDKPA